MTEWDSLDVKVYGESEQFEKAAMHAALLEELGDVQGRRILDYGCGEGAFLDELVAHGAEAYGADISEAMREVASRRSGVRVHAHDDLPGDLDAIASNLVLMMIPTREELRETLWRHNECLKPGGDAIHLITHPSFIDRRHQRFYNVLPEDFDHGEIDTRYQFVLLDSAGKEHSTPEFVDSHRPLETYVNDVIAAGFRLRSLRPLDLYGQGFPSYVMINAWKDRG